MRRRHTIYFAFLLFDMLILLMSFLLDTPQYIARGIGIILTGQDTLITDYVAIAGIGAALLNSAIVLGITIAILWLSKNPVTGRTFVEIGLMTGFSLFGKNFLNIWPIIAGTFLYAKMKREPLSSYISVALMATSLAPVVNSISLEMVWLRILCGVFTGIVSGFIIAPLSYYTLRMQNGMNLYNAGYACGLLAIIIVPVLTALGIAPERVVYWATGYNLHLGIFVGVLCLVMILFGRGMGKRVVWKQYLSLLRSSGLAPSDYYNDFGIAATLVNMGINGLAALGYILLIGGDLNGPTLGGILTIMGFSAYGKHLRNIIPVMLGVVLSSFVMPWSITDPAIQLAALFCTTLAPLAGEFGALWGVIAGFLHSSVVFFLGSVMGGINLYHNGFSGGLVVIVLYPIITDVLQWRKPAVKKVDYLDTL